MPWRIPLRGLSRPGAVAASSGRTARRRRDRARPGRAAGGGVMPPQVRARLDRRILVNYRVDPDVLTAVLPAPFRPVVVGGHAIAGICLIRLGQIRPAGMPALARISTENPPHPSPRHCPAPPPPPPPAFSLPPA